MHEQLGFLKKKLFNFNSTNPRDRLFVNLKKLKDRNSLLKTELCKGIFFGKQKQDTNYRYILRIVRYVSRL